jgi:catechol 2,3-dioxygenase-like lactoylglutathione lyase family enzyme
VRKFAGLVVFPAPDLAAAKKVYTALLGSEPYVDGPYYVGYRVDDVEIGLDPNGPAGGPIVYWDTDDIAASLTELKAEGGSEKGTVKDVGGGMLVATVADAARNVFGLRQHP